MTTWTPEEQKANRGKLVAALRSGEYEQTSTRLRKDSDGHSRFCCLGVGCELAAAEGVIPGWDGASYSGSDALLPIRVQKWLGFSDVYGSLEEGVYYGAPDEEGFDPEADALTELNDTAGWTFDQIADAIEAGRVKLAEVES